MIKLITKLDHFLAKVEEVTLALLLVGMILLASLQVLLRNVWNTGIDWADSSLQNATLLLGLLGAAVATSEGRHLTIDILSRVTKGRSKLLLKVVIGLFAVFLCALLTQGGWVTFKVNHTQWLATLPQGWSQAHSIKQEILEGNIPQWLSQAMLPIGFGLIGFHFLLRLIRDLHALATGKEWEKSSDAGLEGDAALDEMQRRATGVEVAPAAGKEARP